MNVQAKFVPHAIWFDEAVRPIELDETGRWVTVQLLSTNAFHTACIDELQGFDRNSVPQVDCPRHHPTLMEALNKLGDTIPAKQPPEERDRQERAVNE